MLKAKFFSGGKIETELKIILQLFRQYMTDLFINTTARMFSYRVCGLDIDYMHVHPSH